MVQLVRTSAVFSGPSSSGFVSDPGISNYLANNGPEPAYTNWGNLENAHT